MDTYHGPVSVHINLVLLYLLNLRMDFMHKISLLREVFLMRSQPTLLKYDPFIYLEMSPMLLQGCLLVVAAIKATVYM